MSSVTRRNNHGGRQSRLSSYLSTPHPTSFDNISPSGDQITKKTREDKFVRFAYQNIRGATLGKGFDLPVEIEAMSDLDIDVMGMSETNKPWTSENKHEYDILMRMQFRQSQTVYSSAATSRASRYQPGGNLLTINGQTTGRISARGSDELGRFCWYTLRGRRDEGVLVISAYRVCHEAHDSPGPFTAFQQQYTALRAKGVSVPNPR